MKDIDKLLEKYWEGETTIEEERIIKKHFASENLDKDNGQVLFSFFEQEKHIKYKGEISQPKKTKVVKMNFLRKIAVAASILIIVSIGFIVANKSLTDSSNHFVKNEIKDEDEARKIAVEALAMLATNFNKGEETVSANIQNLNKINIINTIIKSN